MNRIKGVILAASIVAFSPSPSPGFFVDARTPYPAAGESPGIIVIDPGHGGHDSGAVGPDGVAEKDVTLALARTLADKMRERCLCTVLLTRDGDTFIPLRDRTAFANRNRADLFISIHMNAAPKKDVDGVETFFASIDSTDEEARRVSELENSSDAGPGVTGAEAEDLTEIIRDMKNTASNHESSMLAEAVQTSLLKAARGDDRGVKQAPFAVLISAEMPAVLIEAGFITNPVSEKRLDSEKGREEIAESIADGIVGFRKKFSKEKDFIGFLNAGQKNDEALPGP